MDSSNGTTLITQEELAEKQGIDLNSYKRYKKLTTLIPELQDMVEDEKVSFSVASRVLAKLSIYYIKTRILSMFQH